MAETPGPGPNTGVRYRISAPGQPQTEWTASFNDTADTNYVAAIEEITGLDSAEIRQNGEDLVGEDGGVHGDFFEGRRPITITGKIYNVTSGADRNEKITKLKEATRALRGDCILSWTPEGGMESYIKCRIAQPTRVTGGWAKDFAISLIAADPNIYSVAVEEKEAKSGSGSVKIKNKGDVDSWPEYEVKGTTVGAFTIEDEVTKEKLVVDYDPTKNINQNFTNAGGPSSFSCVEGEYIYFTNNSNLKIRRRKIDGTGVDENVFIFNGVPTLEGTGITGMCIHSENIYFSIGGKYLGHEGVFVTKVGSEFATYISGTDKATTESSFSVLGLTCSSAKLYWFGYKTSTKEGWIGTSNLTGGELTKKLITFSTGSGKAMVADGTNVYFEWKNSETGKCFIGKMTLAGGSVSKEMLEIYPIIYDNCGMSVVGSKLYWSAPEAGTINRSTTSGGELEEGYIVGASTPTSVYATSEYLYWLNSTNGHFGRYKFTEASAAVLINTKNKTIYKEESPENQNLFGTLNFDQSTWFPMRPGENAVLITAGAHSASLKLKIKSKHAWS